MDFFDAYLYALRFLAHATDGDLSPEEEDQLIDRSSKHARDLGMDTDEWMDRFEAAELQYHRLSDEGPAAAVARFRECAAALRQAGPSAVRPILNDLAEVAASDGTVSDMERFFFHEFADILQGAEVDGRIV